MLKKATILAALSCGLLCSVADAGIFSRGSSCSRGNCGGSYGPSYGYAAVPVAKEEVAAVESTPAAEAQPAVTPASSTSQPTYYNASSSSRIRLFRRFR